MEDISKLKNFPNHFCTQYYGVHVNLPQIIPYASALLLYQKAREDFLLQIFQNNAVRIFHQHPDLISNLDNFMFWHGSHDDMVNGNIPGIQKLIFFIS
jgi:hypothetical protein